ncbi:MAG TPA: HAMP domain-containing sensor histidine kinase [Candidatus Eisenbacteria bacterium]|nr:HAMP domain-containing sensor histidine kinase [Candidatus Eisenbacteria bacterium]
MRITSRKKTIAFAVTLGVLVAAVALVLNISWIVLNWREVVPLVLGVLFFGFIIAGVILNTIFLVREVRRNEQQDSFLNAMTHELKTPITSIRLYLETLQQRQLDEAQRREFYQVMLDDTQRLMGTVEQVLRAARVTQKNAVLNKTEVDVGPLVQDAVELARLRHHLPGEAIAWELDGRPAERLTVAGDREELAAVLSNVLNNAVKYSPKEPRIRVEVVTPDLERVQIKVQDNGIGIPRGELKRVFKRFYRVMTPGSTQVKGSGLGLFIVRTITQRHGGRTWAESEGAGKGTTVTIELPRYQP